MKTLKYKQIFLIIAIAVISLTTSIFAAITCVNVINNNASFNAGPSVIVPTLPPGDGGGTSSKWSGSGNATYPYLIKTIAELNALADEVNGGNTYAGVYFRLENDLDYYNYNLSQYGTFNGIGTKGKIMDSTYALQVPFCGNFNGNGKKISGFVIETRKKCKMQAKFQSNITEYIGTSLGFFGALGGDAQVYNLHLDNFRLKLNLGSDGVYDSVEQYIGGIAGAIVPWGVVKCNVEIYNCKVTNMKAYKGDTDKATNIFVGSILGQFGDGSTTCGDATGYRFTIKDCYVADVNFSESSAVIRGVYVGNIRIGTIKVGQSPPNLQDLILKGSNNDFYADADSNHKPFPAAGNTVGGPSGGTYLAGVTKTNVYTDETQSSYTLSSVGYAGGTSGTTWYRAENYKSGVPQLRVFMDWKLVKARKVVNEISTDSSGKYVPSDYTLPAGASLGTSNTITLLQQTMTVTTPSGCLNSTDHGTGSPSAEITGWDNAEFDTNGKFYYYLMKWSVLKREITIKPTTNTNIYTVYYGTDERVSEVRSTQTVKIYCGTTITISVEKYLKKDTIKSVTYSFKDSGGTNRVVKFTTEGLGYYITSITGGTTITGSSATAITGHWHNNFSFAVETAEKTYIPNFPS